MAVSPEAFPPRKRRPAPESFVSPNLSDQKLLQSLTILSQEISSLQPLRFLLKRNTTSLIRKSRLLSVLFEELLRSPVTVFPPSALLCFEELYIVLQRIKTLLEDCINCSKMWLLIQNESISNSFHELTVELSTLLDIFPGRELNLNQDVLELLCLVRKQCLVEKKPYVDSNDKKLRSQVLEMLERIKREIVPDHSNLALIFDKLSLTNSTSCRDEIESLEDEIQNQTDEKFKSEIIALIGLVRYAKCVLYGASTPRPGPTNRRRKTAADLNIPADFRCPISLDLMRDPVVVSTGQTYDRTSIALWIESGHNTCPKTGQTLAHTELVTNRALKNLIAMWCREQRIPFESTEGNVKSSSVNINKTALTATKMTVSFLINKLTASQSVEIANRLVHELRVLAKTDSDSRTCMAEAGALPLLVKFLGSENPSLQVNAVTTILNLSILEANKTRIVETDGVLNGVIEVLRSGATWEAKGNAAATIFSLTGVHAYRKKLGRKTRVVKGLIDLAKEGPTNSKRDAMVAILNLAGDREAVGKLIEGGVVEMARDVMDGMPEEAVTILEVVVKKGGLMAAAAAYHVISKLAGVLREGTDRARESAAATLVNMCRKGGSEMVAALAAVPGVESVIWEIMGIGTGRGRRKAAALLRMLRRWAAGLEGDVSSETTSTTTTANMNMMSSTRIVLPG
ncbi:hypothetical protein M9H77_22419 [Catharanthus roseus]|uniref:Uncharacterized protein n=1 Tax=Catharanthus roseus TaxID=4058 RepID=A0ACC0AR51_CATRO|nr:hypothetical protein M9H77_22419 [Catharanthus roseus]